MPDYSKGLIYTIKTGDSLYVGSTCNFTKRKWHHKHSLYNDKSKEHYYKLYVTIRANDCEWEMKPYKEFKCDSKLQLSIEEERCRKELGADLNMRNCNCGFDTKNEYLKSYRTINDKKLKEQRQKFRAANKEKIAINDKEYHEQNREKILAKGREKVACECGVQLRRNGLSRHKKSKSHQKWLEKAK